MKTRLVTKFGTLPGDLEQAQYDVLLVLPHDQVVGLEQQALEYAQGVPAPGNEVGHVVPGEEGGWSRLWQVGHARER